MTALEPVTALVASTRAFRTHLESTPRVAVALLEVIVRRFRETTIKRSQSAESDTMGRVAARILELSDRYGTPTDDGTEIEMPISQEELAQWTGASRAGVAHALQAMRELGWLTTHRRQIVVTDIEALRKRAMSPVVQHASLAHLDHPDHAGSTDLRTPPPMPDRGGAFATCRWGVFHRRARAPAKEIGAWISFVR